MFGPKHEPRDYTVIRSVLSGYRNALGLLAPIDHVLDEDERHELGTRLTIVAIQKAHEAEEAAQQQNDNAAPFAEAAE